MPGVRMIAHRLAGVTFVGALGLALVGGLIWALSPDESTGFTITEGGVAAPEATPPEDEEAADGAAEAGEGDEAEPEPTPTPTPTEDPEELIAAAMEPSETTVQVLEAGGGMSATNAVAEHLGDELGYSVINITSARVDVTETTVWFTEGNEDEALALRAREPRVVVVEENQGLNEATNLHVLVGPTSAGPQGGAMTRIEDGTWMVTLFAMAGEQAPTDVDAFERFAARLPIRDIHESIRAGEPLDDLAPYRFPANRRHRYEGLRALPAGLLAAGDAVCSFNPIYGQGMSVAALQARALLAQVRAGTPPTSRTWFAGIRSLIDTAWDLATGADLAVPAVDGRRDLRTRAVNRYLARLHAAAAYDAELTARLIRVSGLVDSPGRLLQPTTIARVLRANRRARRRQSVARRLSLVD
jgi:hypothetical protein